MKPTDLPLPDPVPGENRFEKTLLICDGGIETRRISRTLWEACEEIYSTGGTVSDVNNDPAIHMLNYQLGFVYASRVPDKTDEQYVNLITRLGELAMLTKRQEVLDWLEESDVLTIGGCEARLMVQKTVPLGSKRAVAALRWEDGNKSCAAVLTDASIKEAAFSKSNVSFSFKDLDGEEVRVAREILTQEVAPSLGM